MKSRYLPFALVLLAGSFTLNAQWTNLGSGITTSWRVMAGLFPAGENVIWGFTWHTNSFTPTHDFTRTTDGGQTWHPGTLNGVADGHFPICLYALDGQTAWLATSDEQTPISGHIYKTTDGGNNWVQQATGFTGFNETPAGIWFWNENEGFAYGAACDGSNDDQIAIYTTGDGGENWAKVAASNMPAQLSGEGMCIWNLTGFFSVVGDTIWFGTSRARVFRSTDRGHSWEAFSTPFAGNSSISSVNFRDGQTGLALSFSPFKIARTTDGGETWALVPGTHPSGYIGAQVEYIPGTHGTWLIVPAPFKYLLSYDDGEHWQTYNSNIDIWSLEFLNSTTGFAGSYTSAMPSKATIHKWAGVPLGSRWFVNDDATGANNGQKWEDAFTSLQDALAAAREGDQIWVAEGTYLPDMPGGDPASTFLIDKNLQLYGGFAGTETTLGQRGNPADHPAILSGDLNGDDVEDDFETNRGDNVMTVVTVDPDVSEAAVIDGFTVRGGHSDGNISNQEQRGGGLYTRASIEVRNCFFTQNYAFLSGGGAYLYAGSATDGITVEVNNCKFEKNRSDGTGGGMTPDAWGQNATFTVTGCDFSENTSQWAGGGISAWTRENSGNNNILVEGCSFTKNSTVEFNGGGIQAVFNGANSNFALKNSSFTENETANFTAVALWGLGTTASGNVEVSNCLFEQNSATYAAGLDVGGIGVTGYFTYTVNNCTFVGNQVSDLGGAMEVYGESPSLITVDNCTFEGNAAGTKGGAMIVNTNHPDFEAVIKNCIFENNDSPTGAAVDASNFSENPGMTLDANVTFENCLMSSNTGGAGTVSMSNFGNLKLLNCTIAGNPAGGIVQNENSALALQNTILYNPGFTEYAGAAGNVTATSLGGNLIRDNSFAAHALQQDLQPMYDPQAMFMGDDDYHLHPGSPCINRGVNDGVTALYDLDGEDRIQHGIVDIGAYESPFVTSVREVIVGEIGLSPNPATDFLYLQLPENIAQPVEVGLFDASGKMVGSQVLTTGQPLELKGLVPGMYWVKAVVDDQVYIGKFSKL